MKLPLQNYLSNKIIDAIPRILSLLDKNPYSSTYGSFDRKYWQYKIMDYPCGMQQELVRPLAYVWKTEFGGNRYYQLPRIKDWLEGIFLYHKKSCHQDGSMDDYFPYERAFGATAYALAALTETALETSLFPKSVLFSLETSAAFLAEYRECGMLSNHLAIAACALINLHALTGNVRWKEESARLIEELAAVQSSEGWFPEYEGCDLGYQTVTIEYLARCYRRSPSDGLLGMLRRCIAFVRLFAHPDGSLGGEYCSRNTYNFYPGGFAIMSPHIPEAAEMLGLFFDGIRTGSCNYLEDDGVFGHLLSSYVTVLTAKDFLITSPMSVLCVKSATFEYFPQSGLFIGRTGNIAVFGSSDKGGVYKIFKGRDFIWSDTGLVGKLSDGMIFCQNKHCISQAVCKKKEIVITGRMQKFSSKRLTRIKMIGLRVLSMLFGQFRGYSKAIRFIMQRILIYNRRRLPILFERVITLADSRMTVKDSLLIVGNAKITELYRSTDCVDLHVVTSDSFQRVNLLAWEKLDPDVLVVEKNYEWGRP